MKSGKLCRLITIFFLFLFPHYDRHLFVVVFAATLLEAAVIDSSDEGALKQEVEELLKETHFLRENSHMMSSSVTSDGISERISAMSEYKDLVEFKRKCEEYLEFKRVLIDWARRRIYQPDLMIELVRLVKQPLDNHNNGLLPAAASYKKYESCAVVGNGHMEKAYGGLIDNHNVVIRVDNVKTIKGFERNVGFKTNISYISSSILNECAVEDEEGCFCHPYGSNVPIITRIVQPVHLLDYIKCKSSHTTPLLITDGRFDVLISRIFNYYSLRRFTEGKEGKALEEREGGNLGASSTMQAVMLAVGVCDRVSLFGFKENWTSSSSNTYNIGSFDYEAEYSLYHDLMNNPRAIPFISDKFNFPPIAIWQ